MKQVIVISRSGSHGNEILSRHRVHHSNGTVKEISG